MKKNREIAGVAGGLLAYYLGVVFYVGFFDNFIYQMDWAAPDSLQYLELAGWLLGAPTGGHWLETRAYFFPLFAGLVRWPFGSVGLWIVQMAMWVACGTLLFVNVGRLLRGYWKYFWLAIF